MTLTRSRNNRWLAGVCSGLALHLGMPIWAMRFLWLIAAAVIPGVSLPIVIVAYIILALVMPSENEFGRLR